MAKNSFYVVFSVKNTHEPKTFSSYLDVQDYMSGKSLTQRGFSEEWQMTDFYTDRYAAFKAHYEQSGKLANTPRALLTDALIALNNNDLVKVKDIIIQLNKEFEIPY